MKRFFMAFYRAKLDFVTVVDCQVVCSVAKRNLRAQVYYYLDRGLPRKRSMQQFELWNV